MFRIFCRSILPVAVLLASVPARAEPEQYTFDRRHTQILFFVDHFGFSKSQGEFHDYDGGFVFDPDNWPRSSVDITIRTHSIDMDLHVWDKHMRDKDFFNVSEFPTMRFRSTRVEKSGGRSGLIHGELTLLAVTKPVTLNVTFNKAGVHPVSKQYIAGFSAQAVVKRSEFGMTYGLPAVGDDVDIRLEVEGIRQPAD